MLWRKPKNRETFLTFLPEEELSPIAREIYQKAKVLDSKEVRHVLRKKSELKLLRPIASQGTRSHHKVYAEHMLCRKLLEVKGQCEQLRRHTRVVLMYKASRLNTDRTALLLANSPIQNPTEAEGGDSPAKYLPCAMFVKEPISCQQHTLPSLEHPFRRLAPSLKHPSSLNHKSPLGLPHSRSVWFSASKTKVSSSDHETNGSHAREERNWSSSPCVPLDLSFLLRVAPTVIVPGQGPFRHGMPSYWNVTSSTDTEHAHHSGHT